MNLRMRHGAVVESEREIPVLAQVDVLVVGRGSAGWSAAAAAARRGAGTLVIEQYGFLGGMMTAGAVGCICGPYTCAPGSTTTQIVFGLCGEFMRRLESRGAGYKYLHRFQEDAIRSGDWPLPRLTRADIEGRRLAALYAEFLRSRVPGFERAYLSGLAPQIGIRETRRIMGEYILTGEDVLQARKFDDGICNAAWPIELHDPAGPDTRRTHLEGDNYYQVPFRCLVPLRVDQLLVAGRCLSSTREGNGSARVMAYAMAMGEAAGMAAAVALESDVRVRGVDGRALRRELEHAGAALA